MNINISRQLLVIYVLAIFMLIAITIMSMVFQISIPSFTRDVTAIANIHPFSGILSTLGIYLWCISASTCFFAAMILRDINQTQSFSFLLCSALLSAYLMLDDAFLFHETLASRYLGISEKVVFVILGMAVLAYLKSFFHAIVETKYVTLLLAFVFFAFSVLIDTILEPWLWRLGDWKFFIEDGAKWLGIVNWCTYHVRNSYFFVTNAYKLRNKANA